LIDPNFKHIVEFVNDQAWDFVMVEDGILIFRGRVWVLEDVELKRMILEDGYKSHLDIHLACLIYIKT